MTGDEKQPKRWSGLPVLHKTLLIRKGLEKSPLFPSCHQSADGINTSLVNTYQSVSSGCQKKNLKQSQSFDVTALNDVTAFLM